MEDNMKTEEELDRLWRDPSHWKCGLFYYCKEDPRLVLPKRNKHLGLTVNFSRPMAMPLIALTFAIIILPFQIARSSGAPFRGNESYVVIFLVIIAVLVLWLWLAERKTTQ